MRPDDGWLIFGLGVTLGWVAGWLGHACYLAVTDAARLAVRLLRKLSGWHRARDARRLDLLEAKIADLYPDLP